MTRAWKQPVNLQHWRLKNSAEVRHKTKVDSGPVSSQLEAKLLKASNKIKKQNTCKKTSRHLPGVDKLYKLVSPGGRDGSNIQVCDKI